MTNRFAVGLLGGFALLVLSLVVPPSDAMAQSNAAISQSSGRFERIAATTAYVPPDDTRFRLAEPGFRFRGGTSIISTNPLVYRIRAFNGVFSSGKLDDGRAIVLWPSFAQPDEVRVAETAEQAGQENGIWPERPTPTSPPRITGYSFVAAANLSGTNGEYLGLWRRNRGTPQTLIVSFRSDSRAASDAPTIVGRLPLRLATIYMGMPSFHGESWSIHMTSRSSVGQPLLILNYEWMPNSFRPLAARRQ